MKKSTMLCKRIHVGLASLMSLALLAGCSTKEATQKSESQKVEIEFFQMKTEAVDTYNKIITKFEAENPNIKVTQNNVPDGKNVLQTRMASGDVPDVFSIYPNESNYKVQANDGYLLDLTGQKFLENANSEVLNSVKVSGKDYALPISLNTIGVFYNTKIFDQLKLAVPTNYSELIASAEKIKAAGITPFALADKDSWTVGIQANQMTGEEMGKAKVEQFFEDVKNGKQSTAKSAEMNTVADRILELRKYGPEDAAAIGYDQAISTFATEKAAMFINGIWAIPSVQKANPDIKFGMFPLPATKAEDTKVIYGIDAAVAISAKTKQKDAALKFAEFLSRTETAQIYADSDRSPSVIKGVEMNFEPIQKLTQMLADNKSFEWLHFKWAPGMEAQWNTEAQNLAVSKDKNAYFNALDKDFAASK